MQKKMWMKAVALMMSILLLIPAIGVFADETETRVFKSDDTEILFDNDAKPVEENDRMLLPLRKVAEALDTTVYWIPLEDGTNFVQVVSNDRMLNFAIDDKTIEVYRFENGEAEFKKALTMPIAAQLKDIGDNTYTYVPLRATADTLYATWEAIDACNDIEELQWQDNAKSVAYTAKSDAQNYNKITMPEGNVADADSLRRITGTLSQNDGGNWCITNGDKIWSLGLPVDANVFWSQQIGSPEPAGITVTVTGFWNDDDSEISVQRTTTGILPVMKQCSLKDIEKSGAKLLFNGKEIKDGGFYPLGCKLTVNNLADGYEVLYDGKAVTENGFVYDGAAIEIKKANVTVTVPECLEEVGECKPGSKVTLKQKDGYVVDWSTLKNVEADETHSFTANKDVKITVDWVKVTMAPGNENALQKLKYENGKIVMQIPGVEKQDTNYYIDNVVMKKDQIGSFYTEYTSEQTVKSGTTVSFTDKAPEAEATDKAPEAAAGDKAPEAATGDKAPEASK